MAREHGLISAGTEEAVAGVAVMRSLAAHGTTVSSAQARDFVTLAGAVLYVVDRDLRASQDG